MLRKRDAECLSALLSIRKSLCFRAVPASWSLVLNLTDNAVDQDVRLCDPRNARITVHVALATKRAQAIKNVRAATGMR